VTPRTTDAGEQRYVLVFGEGRLTAFRNLGEKEIPAIVVEISDEDAYLQHAHQPRLHCPGTSDDSPCH
jgi:ParB family chromosome partitioning protein